MEFFGTDSEEDGDESVKNCILHRDDLNKTNGVIPLECKKSKHDVLSDSMDEDEPASEWTVESLTSLVAEEYSDEVATKVGRLLSVYGAGRASDKYTDKWISKRMLIIALGAVCDEKLILLKENKYFLAKYFGDESKESEADRLFKNSQLDSALSDIKSASTKITMCRQELSQNNGISGDRHWTAFNHQSNSHTAKLLSTTKGKRRRMCARKTSVPPSAATLRLIAPGPQHEFIVTEESREECLL